DIGLTSNSVPLWLWAVGVWFLGLVFQLVKTGALLVVILGVVALVFRTCDSPDADRFCQVIGLQSDVSRGFVPFWIVLGVPLVAFGLHKRPGRYLIWTSTCVGLVALYNLSVWWRHQWFGQALPFWWQLAIVLSPVALAPVLLFAPRLGPGPDRAVVL